MFPDMSNSCNIPSNDLDEFLDIGVCAPHSPEYEDCTPPQSPPPLKRKHLRIYLYIYIYIFYS